MQGTFPDFGRKLLRRRTELADLETDGFYALAVTKLVRSGRSCPIGGRVLWPLRLCCWDSSGMQGVSPVHCTWQPLYAVCHSLQMFWIICVIPVSVCTTPLLVVTCIRSRYFNFCRLFSDVGRVAMELSRIGWIKAMHEGYRHIATGLFQMTAKER